jgi:type IV pilus assembly protein PilN
MKIPINLASQPFRHDRAMLVVSIALSLVLVGTMSALVSLFLTDRAQLADVRAEISNLNAKIRSTAADQAQLDAVLRKPENAEVFERSVFLNSLLVRKGISWTQIFADLEETLPHNLRILQIHPSVDVGDRITLDVQFGAESPAPMVELLQKMGESELFSHPEIKSQQAPTQSEPLWRYRVSVDYAQKLEL